MRWYIRLEDTLKYRDVLSWKNIDAKPRHHCFTEESLSSMNEVIYPLKSLSIFVTRVTEIGMSCLCNMGSALESLDLTCWSSTTVFLNAPFPKLKQLYLDCRKMNEMNLDLDLSKFSNTLERFRLHGTSLDESSMKSLATLKQLKVLSFRSVQGICQNVHFLEALSSLHQLRSLDLTESISDMPAHYRCQFLSVISKLPNLENCDISLNDKIEKDFVLEIMKCRKWKKFGMQHCCDFAGNYFSYDNFKPFADQVFAMYDETILSTLQTYTHDLEIFSPATERIFDIIHTISDDQIPIIENVLLTISEKEEPEGLLLDYLERGRFTDNFTKQLLNMMCSMCEEKELNTDKMLCLCDYEMPYYLEFERVPRTMLDIVQKDLNKGFTRILLKSLLIVVGVYMRKHIREAGVEDVG